MHRGWAGKHAAHSGKGLAEQKTLEDIQNMGMMVHTSPLDDGGGRIAFLSPPLLQAPSGGSASPSCPHQTSHASSLCKNQTGRSRSPCTAELEGCRGGCVVLQGDPQPSVLHSPGPAGVRGFWHSSPAAVTLRTRPAAPCLPSPLQVCSARAGRR